MHALIEAKAAFTTYLHMYIIGEISLHRGLEDCNADGRVNNDPSTSDRNLVSFGPVTPEFARLIYVLKGHNCQVGFKLGFAMHF